DDDRGRQPLEHVDFGPAQRRHEALDEGAVGLVDEALRLRGDGAEHQRRLARARDAGEHGQAPLRDLDADVLQVVLARALDPDEAVAVGAVRGGGGHGGTMASRARGPQDQRRCASQPSIDRRSSSRGMASTNRSSTSRGMTWVWNSYSGSSSRWPN